MGNLKEEVILAETKEEAQVLIRALAKTIESMGGYIKENFKKLIPAVIEQAKKGDSNVVQVEEQSGLAHFEAPSTVALATYFLLCECA